MISHANQYCAGPEPRALCHCTIKQTFHANKTDAWLSCPPDADPLYVQCPKSKPRLLAGHDKIGVQVILKFTVTFLFFIGFYFVRWIFTYITKKSAP
jgi:hypothetical protein